MKIVYLLISIIALFASGNLSAQKTNAATHKIRPWTEDIYQTWKIEGFSGIPGIEKHKEITGIPIYLKFYRNGKVFLSSRESLIIDSFFAFEHGEKRCLSIGLLTFTVTGIDKNHLGLRANSPFGHDIKIALTSMPDKNQEKNDYDKLIADRTWEQKDEDYHPNYSRFNGGFAISLKSDHTCEIIRDTILSKGNWQFDENFILSIQEGNKKNIFYLKSYSPQEIIVQIPGDKDSFLTFRKSDARSPIVRYNEWKLRQETLKKESLIKTKPDTVAVTSGNYPPPPEISVPKAVIYDPVIRMQKSLANTYKATIHWDIFNTRNNPLPEPATIQLKPDKSFKIKYGKKSYQGKWRYIAPYEKSALILEYDGKEHYIPLNIQSPNDTIKEITLTLVLPGTKEIVNVDFLPDNIGK